MRFETTAGRLALTKFLAAMLLSSLVFGTSAFAGEADTTQSSLPFIQAKAEIDSSDTAIWACPMHPEVHSQGPGSCTECKMALVERDSEED